MGANPNIFINKENRRVVPPEEENFFVSAEEFKAIDTAFATKADQSSLDSLSGSVSGLSSFVTEIDGRVDTLETDLGTAETNITNLQSNKEDAANKVTDFTDPNDTDFPTTKAVDDFLTSEVPQQDPDNFATASNVTYIQNEYGRRVSSSVSFDRSAIYASEFDTDTKRVIAPVYTDLAITKTGAFHKNKADVFHSSETVPTVISSPASWLIVTGDSYLTGFENLNYMEMEYFERIKISSTYYEDVVVCNITAIENGNTDLSPYLLIDLRFDQDITPLASDSIVNRSLFYGDILVPIINNTTLGGSFVEYDTDKYAFQVIQNTTSLASATNVVIPLDSESSPLFGTEITAITRVQFFTQGSDAERGVISNRDGNTGWNLIRKTTGEFALRVGTIDNTASTETNSSGANIQLDNGYYAFGGRFKWDGVNRNGELFMKSFHNFINFAQFGSSSGTSARTSEHLENLSLDANIVGGSRRDKSMSHLLVFNKYLTEEQIENYMIAMDGPNNAP